jgi:SAM-dependent methyltransferase
MALDYNGIKLLLWAKNLGVTFNRTLTLGHQGFCCSPRRLRRALRDFGLTATQEERDRCFHRAPCAPIFVDEFLRLLGAKELVSVDNSSFEEATLLHDLNEPFPERERGRFDLVLDGGTLEHIFDYPAALRHCLELLRVGGHFITITPASNLMGHGFYQFSPEFFFRIFTAENGFALRKIILFDCFKTDAAFFQVSDPAVTGLRTELVSSRPFYLAVLARRTAITPVLARPPQQSDYAAAWEQHQKNLRAEVIPSSYIWRIRRALNLHVPLWLRNWRDALRHSWQCGAPKLSNRRHFRKLSRKEIFNDRAEV